MIYKSVNMCCLHDFQENCYPCYIASCFIYNNYCNIVSKLLKQLIHSDQGFYFFKWTGLSRISSLDHVYQAQLVEDLQREPQEHIFLCVCWHLEGESWMTHIQLYQYRGTHTHEQIRFLWWNEVESDRTCFDSCCWIDVSLHCLKKKCFMFCPFCFCW